MLVWCVEGGGGDAERTFTNSFSSDARASSASISSSAFSGLIVIAHRMYNGKTGASCRLVLVGLIVSLRLLVENGDLRLSRLR